MKIVTSAQMRDLENRSEKAGISTQTLMENAGLAVARRVWDHLGLVKKAPLTVLVGPGNNGGDGLVAARHLNEWGARPTVFLCLPRKPHDPLVSGLLKANVPVHNAFTKDGLVLLDESLHTAHMVLDAILGIGRSRAIDGPLKEIISRLMAEKLDRPDLRIVALDLPTGLDADTGEVDPAGVVADVTVTLGYPKIGLYMPPGAEYAGRIEAVDIGTPADLDSEIPLELMTRKWAAAALPPRPLFSHKGTFGRAFIVAGSVNYIGAAYLAAAGAGRVGAGLVTLAVPQGIQAAVAAKATEATYVPLPEDPPGEPAQNASGTILANVEGYDSLLIGCGLGRSASAVRLIEDMLRSYRELPPTVVDADGLNFLAGLSGEQWWERLNDDAIVTPHPGEMARLLNSTVREVETHRTNVAIEAAVKWNKIVVLKGAYTVVAYPTGQAMLSPFANPAMATAGTGDVLAGAIAGLLAQGLSPEKAAALGVYLHGLAGEIASAEIGDAGMLAGDLLPALPRAIRDLKANRPFVRP
ncbi:MAG: NAD(P)H-hydrate dehydratase [SAR202 cluster bacterium]|nr:NAD(P)H-hydrate dehydratase [SAR202 cluster bacterium]